MESLFENRIILTKERYKELSTIIRQYPRLKFILACSAISFVCGFYFLLKTYYVPAIITFLFGLYFLALYLIVPYHQMMSEYKRANLLYHGDEERKYVFYENEYVCHIMNISADVPYQYKDIKKINETKHLYYFTTNYKIFVLIDKEGFTKGNVEDFLLFIRSRIV